MFDKKTVLFFVKFFVFFGFFHWLLFAFDFSFLENTIAGIEAGLLGLERKENLLFIGTEVYAIVPSCTGLVSAIILGGIIFSLKKPAFLQKMAIFIAGSVVLFLLNLVRVFLVLLIGAMHGMQAAETAHIASWFAMSTGIIIAWYYLTKKITRIKNFEGFL